MDASRQRLHRTELLLGQEVMARLREVRVAVFGVGGVGSWCAEALVRSGVYHLTLVDPDVVCVTNVNRQLQATARNVGQPKVDELRNRLLEINPEADITTIRQPYNATTSDSFELRRFDYVLDAIDTLTNKVHLLATCLAAGVTVLSSMGAAAKLDSTQIRTAPLSRTRHCPLARMVRKRLRRRGVRGAFLCVYSEELPLENRGRAVAAAPAPVDPDDEAAEAAEGIEDGADEADVPDLFRRVSATRVNGTVAHMTGAFGFALAGLVIQDVVRRVDAAGAAAVPAQADMPASDAGVSTAPRPAGPGPAA